MAHKPKRIQRKRTKGWRMPEGAVSCTRPGRFGNPFHVGQWLTLYQSLKLFRDAVHGIWDPENVQHLSDDPAHEIYEAFCVWKSRLGKHPTETIKAELRGKDLACFCSLDQPCHADVLLELANA